MSRSNAEDRRAQVIDAAIATFAQTGFEGTKTTAIAAQVGVSQPYLFQLFPTKKAMFIAAWEEACTRILDALADSIDGVATSDRLRVLAAAYDQLVTTNRELLTIQTHAWSAAPADPDIAEATRVGLDRLRAFAVERLEISDDDATRLLSAMAFYNINISVGTTTHDGCTVTRMLQTAQ